LARSKTALPCPTNCMLAAMMVREEVGGTRSVEYMPDLGAAIIALR
jgi:hypothetical protein